MAVAVGGWAMAQLVWSIVSPPWLWCTEGWAQREDGSCPTHPERRALPPPPIPTTVAIGQTRTEGPNLFYKKIQNLQKYTVS